MKHRTFPPSSYYGVALICCLFGFEPGILAAEDLAKSKEGSLKRVMHRTQAGVANPEGWFLAESTKGHFKVKLPAAFNDFEVSGIDENGNRQENHIVGTLLPDNTKYSATLIIQPATRVKERFDGFANSFRKAGTLKDARRFQFQGQEASETRVGDSNRLAVMRCIIGSKGLFLLIVEFDTDKEAQLAGRIKTFMESFEFPAADSKK